MLNQRGSMPGSVQDPACACCNIPSFARSPSVLPYQRFSTFRAIPPFCGTLRQLTGNWHRFLLHITKAPGLGESGRFVVCEVKLHLARSSVLVISACPVAQYHTGSYLLMTAEFTPRAQETFAPSKDFWVAGTYAHKHALRHAVSLADCPRRSCSLINATCVLLLPGGPRNLSA